MLSPFSIEALSIVFRVLKNSWSDNFNISAKNDSGSDDIQSLQIVLFAFLYILLKMTYQVNGTTVKKSLVTRVVWVEKHFIIL
jgi:hypothetical protein